ncbi:MAG: SLC13 family permease [Bacteroidia bacterium]|nr:SLC13 family permease [Bacteroidia bacterium]
MNDPKIIIVSLVILGMVLALYKEVIKPVMVFVVSITVLMAAQIITPKEALSGFANEQIAVIFLLLIISDVIKRSAALDYSIYRLFRPGLSYRAFLFRMSTSVAGISAFVNNTPLVALMMPYVYDWAKRKQINPSKVLMPLSMAAIVGGTVTLIGTSTNLVVSGLATDAGLPPLKMFDFTPIGLPIMLLVVLYIIVMSKRLLPDRTDALTDFKEHTREYLIETRVPPTSGYVGKSIDDNKLRQLRGLYVVEIIRGNKTIAPVSPKDVIEPNDILIFAGEIDTVIDLLNTQTELVPADFSEYPMTGKVEVIEAIIAPNSSLINKPVNKTNFREMYDAGIIAVNRDGEKISGKVGDIELRNGDLLLVVGGKGFRKRAEQSRDLILVSKRREINHGDKIMIKWILMAIAAAFILEACDMMSLFMSLFLITGTIALTGLLNVEDVKKSLDLELMVMLAMAIGVGKAISNSGADQLFAREVIGLTSNLHDTMGVLLGLYLVTNILTMFVTNAAAVAITFPIAVATGQQLGIHDMTPLLLTIAFASSADFITPFGYQTNLMVFGPGGYRFADYIRYGIIPTFIYMAMTIFGIAWWYNMI